MSNANQAGESRLPTPGLAAEVNQWLIEAERCGLSQEFERADQHFHCALAVASRVFGPASIQVAIVLRKLGGAHCRAGKLQDAHRAYVQALEITEQALGPDHAEVAGIYHSLARLELARGRFVTGEPYARRSVEIRERGTCPDQTDVAEDVATLAALLDGQGRYAESETLYRRALSMFEAMGGQMQDKALACRVRLRELGEPGADGA